MAASHRQRLEIDVHHITRVEGHGNIVVNTQNGKVIKCELQIVEAPRFFEAILRNQPYQNASHLSSRICGICAVTHATTSLRATEIALGIEPTEQTVLLRKLNLCAEMIDSHILHVYMLVAPDLLGIGSVFPLAKSAPEVVHRALRMKKVAGDLSAAIGGRHTHPIAMTVGGFTHLPTNGELSSIGERLEGMSKDLEETVNLFKDLSFPTFERETEYIALQADNEYCLLDGHISSSDGGTWPIERYQDVTNEMMVDHSTAKHAQNLRSSYMVGALSRFRLNYKDLHPEAKSVAQELDLSPDCINPYKITIAQIVEIVQCAEEAISIIEQLLENGLYPEDPVSPSRLSGEGVGACEAPRGTLYHHYVIEDGLIVDANCITPTAQNLANIEADMKELVASRMDQPLDETRLALEMLVRAYDPCISCSTHMLDIRFI
ncbi:MAG: hydrogenase/sulfur reductase subunit alpha [Chloroflexi bacterium RBG_16_48_8]|nr:MAG: hydrogenase/sulfur reductase subunit alpha [Chloroflexi bacterium RBG_16_48_8]